MQRIKNRIETFMTMESISGLLLFLGVILALCVSNTELYDEYQALINLPISITIGDLTLGKPLIKWVNDGLMALFFLVLTLEAKFHVLEGEFSSPGNFRLACLAALGGVIVPAILYVFFSYPNPEHVKGWAIPIATDTAFVLGILSFFKNKVPLSTRLFVVALSIIDDIIAVVILAVFYTEALQITPLLIAIILISLLAIANLKNIERLSVYLLIGAGLWLALVEAGIHGTIAGVLIGLFVPVHVKRENCKATSPLKKLEHFLHPLVALIVLPLFAFLNSEISFKELGLNDFYSPITIGIFVGLFIGKQLGILIFSFIPIAAGICKLPHGITWRTYYGISILCGIGFTFSLFIGLLSFEEAILINQMKLGVILGSVVSAIGGIALLLTAPLLPHAQVNTHPKNHGT